MNNLNKVQTSELKAEKTNKLSFSENENTLYKQNVKKLEKLYRGIEKNFLGMAFALYPIYKKKLYKIEGYANIYFFAKDKLSLSRGTCNEFIQICDKFCIINKDCSITELKPEFKDYSISKLRVLISVDKNDYDKFHPRMTVREMKMKKKELKNSLTNQSNTTEHNCLSGEVEITIPEIFEHTFNSYDELMNMKEDITKAWEDIKIKRPHAHFKIVIEGIEL